MVLEVQGLLQGLPNSIVVSGEQLDNARLHSQQVFAEFILISSSGKAPKAAAQVLGVFLGEMLLSGQDWDGLG